MDRSRSGSTAAWCRSLSCESTITASPGKGSQPEVAAYLQVCACVHRAATACRSTAPPSVGSWSLRSRLRSLGGKPKKLLVGQDPPLCRSFRLHPHEQPALTFLVKVEAELLGLDPDRVEPALLPEHDPALGADQLGRVRLDRRRVVELARDRAALTDEQVLADDGLPRVEFVAAQLPHERRDLA